MPLPVAFGLQRGWPVGPGQLPPPSGIPPLALTFSDRTPLQFSNGAYLETAA